MFCGQAPLLLTIGTRDEDVPPQMVQDFYEDFISEKGGLTESLPESEYVWVDQIQRVYLPASRADRAVRPPLVPTSRCRSRCQTAHDKRRGPLEHCDFWPRRMEEGQNSLLCRACMRQGVRDTNARAATLYCKLSFPLSLSSLIRSAARAPPRRPAQAASAAGVLLTPCSISQVLSEMLQMLAAR